jgi:pyruvate/2-oxoacid:ferredoxin oxidoreductase beta subunit
MTRSEYVSTLPPWRRLLAMVNWRPVYDIEQETERLRIESLESEKRILESEKQMLASEKRLKLLKKENKRLAELESRMDALLLNADSSSQTPPATGSS